jgi:hypothetical protein
MTVAEANADTTTVTDPAAAAEAVSKRTAANRLNAARSTGPRSPEGKARSRLNALKHGMTASLPLIPGEDPELVNARNAAWKEELNPQSDLQEYLVEQIVVSSLQLARCDRAIAARLKELIDFGPFDLEEVEAQEVADLTRQLFWDPRGPIALYPHFRGLRHTPRISMPETVNDPLDPNKLVQSLQSSYTGCRWLLDRWADLRSLLEQGLKWQAPDRLKAIRMLGRQPMDALADERVLSIYLACDAMDPTAATSLDDLLTETTPDELKLFKERVRGRGADWKKPTDPRAGEVALYALIDQVTTGLTAKLAQHQKRREFIEAARLDLFAFDDSKEGEQARRYHSAKVRELSRLLTTYFKVGKEARAAADGKSSPAGCPEGAAAAPMPETSPVTGAESPGWVQPTDVGWVQPTAASQGKPADRGEGCPTPPAPEASLSEPAGCAEPHSAAPTRQEPMAADETKPNLPVEPGDETKPKARVESGDETKPNRAGASSAKAAEPPIPGGQAGIPGYLDELLAREHPFLPYPPRIREALRDLSSQWRS